MEGSGRRCIKAACNPDEIPAFAGMTVSLGSTVAVSIKPHRPKPSCQRRLASQDEKAEA